jgi:hypothetical protein
MKQKPFSEANSISADEEILRLLRNLMFHFRFYRSPPLYPTGSPTNADHILTAYFCSSQLDSILSVHGTQVHSNTASY